MGTPPPEVQKALTTIVNYCSQTGMSAYKLVFFPDPASHPGMDDAAGFMVVSLGTRAQAAAMNNVVTAELQRQRTYVDPSEAQMFKSTLLPPGDNPERPN